MSARFEELAWSPTPIGEVSLRRRTDPATGVDIFEVKLGDEYLMSSLFTVAEIELARLALTRLDGTRLDVVVGGLGLGYTAQTVLEDDRVADLVVVDLLEPVIRWHRDGLVPVGHSLTADARCRSSRATSSPSPTVSASTRPGPAGCSTPSSSTSTTPRPTCSPTEAPGSTASTAPAACSATYDPEASYALWSNDPPEETYLQVLRQVFVDVEAVVVTFPNPLQDRPATNTVYLATNPG